MPQDLAQATLASESNCTDIEPPQGPSGTAPRWTGQGWELAPDHRGEVWHDPQTGASIRVDEVGVEPPTGWVWGLPPAPLPTAEEEWGRVRKVRNSRLAASDWTQLPDVPLSQELREQWNVYRQALRDVTLQPDPFNIVWPTPPG
jgi:hypothetical protein